MPFRLLLIGLFFFLIFTGCKENGNGTVYINSVDTLDELSEFVSGLNYVINLPEKESLSFNPSRDFAVLGTQNFSSMDNGGNTLTYNINQTGKAELELDLSPPYFLNFNYAICTSVAEIGLAFPELNIREELKDHLVFVATTESWYTSEELLFGTAIEHSPYLQILVNPDNPDFLFGFMSLQENIYRLEGDYILSGNGLKFDGLVIDNYENSFVDCRLNFFCNAN